MTIADNIAARLKVTELLELADDFTDLEWDKLRDEILKLRPLPKVVEPLPENFDPVAFGQCMIKFGKYQFDRYDEIETDYLEWLQEETRIQARELKAYLDYRNSIPSD